MSSLEVHIYVATISTRRIWLLCLLICHWRVNNWIQPSKHQITSILNFRQVCCSTLMRMARSQTNCSHGMIPLSKWQSNTTNFQWLARSTCQHICFHMIFHLAASVAMSVLLCAFLSLSGAMPPSFKSESHEFEFQRMSIMLWLPLIKMHHAQRRNASCDFKTKPRIQENRNLHYSFNP